MCKEILKKNAWHREMCFCPSFKKCLVQWYLMTHGNINRHDFNLQFPSKSRETSKYLYFKDITCSKQDDLKIQLSCKQFISEISKCAGSKEKQNSVCCVIAGEKQNLQK